MTAVEESYRGRQVRVFRLRREAVVRALEDAARRLVEARPEVLEVRLFGSLVGGNAGPGSDADVLVVLREATPDFLDRIPEYCRYFAGIGIGCDVFPYTLDELTRLGAEHPHFATAMTAGQRLAVR